MSSRATIGKQLASRDDSLSAHDISECKTKIMECMAVPEEPEGGELPEETPGETPEGGEMGDDTPKTRRKRHSHGSRKRAVTAFCKYVHAYHSISLSGDWGVLCIAKSDLQKKWN